MDPIEKLLSELAPAHATADLDAAMTRMFDRADRRARVRRIVRGSAALSVVFVAGLVLGMSLNDSSAPVTSSEVTYLIESGSASQPMLFDYSNQGEPVTFGSVRMSVNIQRVEPMNAIDADQGS